MDQRQWRKERPVYSGVLKYFPDALLEVAHVSFVGNQQHNPGQPLHWDKSKSTDEPDALTRHLLDAGTRDTDGTRHSAKVAWRALANLQREIEAERDEQEKESTPAIALEWRGGSGGAYYVNGERACNHVGPTGFYCTLPKGHDISHCATDVNVPDPPTWRNHK